MEYKNVEEYSGNFELPLPREEIPKLLAYNVNDVEYIVNGYSFEDVGESIDDFKKLAKNSKVTVIDDADEFNELVENAFKKSKKEGPGYNASERSYTYFNAYYFYTGADADTQILCKKIKNAFNKIFNYKKGNT